MAGLRYICKLYGSLRVTSGNERGTWYWNYKTDEPFYVPDKEKQSKPKKVESATDRTMIAKAVTTDSESGA